MQRLSTLLIGFALIAACTAQAVAQAAAAATSAVQAVAAPTVAQAAVAQTEDVASDPLLQFRQLEASFNGGKGMVDQILAAGRNRTAGQTLAWGASYLWDAYVTAYEVSGEHLWLDKLVREFDAAFAVRDDVLGHADYKGRVRPVWGTYGYTGDEYYAWAVHNGWAAYQMLRFARIVTASPALAAKYGDKAQDYVKLLRSMVDAFDEDWRQGATPGQGYYIFPADMPFASRGRKMPLNQHNAMGLTLFLMADLTGEQKYLDKAVAMAAYFRSVIKKLPDGAYVWTYWGNENEAVANPPQALNASAAAAFSGEDISHAVINARFAYEAYLHDAVFDENDMRAIARTVSQHIWAPDAQGNSAVFWQMNGRGDRLSDGSLIHVSRGWAFLAQFDLRVLLAARQTFAAGFNSASAVLRLLGSAQLVRWTLSEADMQAVLDRAAHSADPLTSPVFIKDTTPQPYVILHGPAPVTLQLLSGAPVREVELRVDDALLSKGPTLPEDLLINSGELSDGAHVLQISISTDQPVGYVFKQTVPFSVANVRLQEPSAGALVRGAATVRIAFGLPPEAVRQVEVRLDDTLLYSGAHVPASIPIDTEGVADGWRQLGVKIVTTAGAVAQTSARVQVDNWWELIDPFTPPMVSGWFGIFDNAKTSEVSAGWDYATADAPSFFNDQSRRVRTRNGEEYLIWEAPALRTAVVTLYATDPAAAGLLGLATSSDGIEWTPLPYSLAGDQTSAGGWHKLEASAQVPVNLAVSHFKVTLAASDLPADAVQLGEVVLTGKQK